MLGKHRMANRKASGVDASHVPSPHVSPSQPQCPRRNPRTRQLLSIDLALTMTIPESMPTWGKMTFKLWIWVRKESKGLCNLALGISALRSGRAGAEVSVGGPHGQAESPTLVGPLAQGQRCFPARPSSHAASGNHRNRIGSSKSKVALAL